jgi:hypothetical protein
VPFAIVLARHEEGNGDALDVDFRTLLDAHFKSRLLL